MIKYCIIGAGPSGLTAGMFLKQPFLIFEKRSHPGGHAGSFFEEGYTFDYGPHIMFSKNKEVLNFMVKALGKNVHKCKRNNKISFKGKLIKYPFENDLKSLPLEDNFSCLYDYVFNPYKRKYSRPKNLEEWFLKNFGKSICDKYLFPYNEKVWNLPVRKLSMMWADRIPNPPAEDIIKSSIGYETEGYLHQLYYHYPLRGGYQALSEAFAQKVPVRYNCEIKNITKMPHGGFKVSDSKNTYEAENIISTLPIQELIKITNFPIPDRVKAAIRKLIVNPILIVSLGIRGEDKEQYTAIYFPEADFLVNRISFPKTFSPLNAPKGHYSIQAEITCMRNASVWKERDENIIDHVIDGLVKRNLLDKKQIVYKNLTRSKYAYVVYDTEYEKNARVIREWFPRQGIHLVGRFSFFEYINVDGAIERSKSIVEKINQEFIDLNKITF